MSKKCAETLSVLADRTRLQVVLLLLNGPQHVGELNRVLHIEQSLLSHHLGVLRGAGLVIAERDGKAVRYRLSPELGSDQMGGTINLGCCHLSFNPSKSRSVR